MQNLFYKIVSAAFLLVFPALLSAQGNSVADNLVLARWLIRNIAYNRGCVATFAPKVEEGIAGNGFHVQRFQRNLHFARGLPAAAAHGLG